MIKIPLNNDEIKKIVSNLEKKELKTSSHLYKRFPGHTIGQVFKLILKARKLMVLPVQKMMDIMTIF